MRKKIFTSLVVGTLAAVCALSFTACGGGNDIPKGEKVDEAGWKAAIEATVKATNYTVESSTETAYSSTFKDEDDKTVTTTSKQTATGTAYVTADSVYEKADTTYKTTGASNIEEGAKDVDATGVQEHYYTVKEAVLWRCSYSETTYKQGAPDDYVAPEAKWEAESNDFDTADAAKAALASQTDLSYVFGQQLAASKEATEYKAVSELYSAFTYESGKYSATLYNKYGEECSIEASIKGGYVIGISIKTSEEETEDGESEKYEYTMVYTFKNYGKTTVTAPKGATDAIAAKEAE